MSWHVYMVECADGTFYTGITTDLERRVGEHNRGTGAKYTARRLPVQLVYQEPADNRSEASKREYAIKRLPRISKMAMAVPR